MTHPVAPLAAALAELPRPAGLPLREVVLYLDEPPLNRDWTDAEGAVVDQALLLITAHLGYEPWPGDEVYAALFDLIAD